MCYHYNCDKDDTHSDNYNEKNTKITKITINEDHDDKDHDAAAYDW